MFFLKKIFQLRDHANPNAEKPFLEHLEDLRVCITRIVLTLLISTVVCFIFRNELMEIIRRPIAQVWERKETKALKGTNIKLEDWESAKQVAHSILVLPDGAHREELLKRKAAELDTDLEELREDSFAAQYYAAVLILKNKKERIATITEMDGLSDALRSKVLALLEGEPNVKLDARGKLVLMQALKPTEGFMLSIKLALFAGIVVSFPFLLYFLLQFVVPGMHDAERRALWPAMTVGFGLFLGGVFFAYFIVLPKVLEFFHTYSADMMIENEWRIGYYIAFATQFTLIFGIAFELPVVVMTLVRLSILNSEMMRNTRAYAILAIFVVAAIITPTPDAFTLCLLAGPMVILYEICIWMAYFIDRKRARVEAEEDAERLAKLLALKKRRASLGEDEEDDDDDHDPDHPSGPVAPLLPGPDDHGQEPGHDYDPDHHDHEHGDDHYDYAADHGFDHDHDPGDDHYHTDDDEFHAEHHGESGAGGYGDDEHAGLAVSETEEPPSGPEKRDPNLEQEAFDFHEEVDPALTEEGEQEDISDPWPEEDQAEPDPAGKDDAPAEPADPFTPDESIPEEEQDRESDDPYKKDQD